MKITKSVLREIIREEITLNEIRGITPDRKATVADADDFIREVLKLGSRTNIFDKWVRKEGISSNELSEFVALVADRIKTKWT